MRLDRVRPTPPGHVRLRAVLRQRGGEPLVKQAFVGGRWLAQPLEADGDQGRPRCRGPSIARARPGGRAHMHADVQLRSIVDKEARSMVGERLLEDEVGEQLE